MTTSSRSAEVRFHEEKNFPKEKRRSEKPYPKSLAKALSSNDLDKVLEAIKEFRKLAATDWHAAKLIVEKGLFDIFADFLRVPELQHQAAFVLIHTISQTAAWKTDDRQVKILLSLLKYPGDHDYQEKVVSALGCVASTCEGRELVHKNDTLHILLSRKIGFDLQCPLSLLKTATSALLRFCKGEISPDVLEEIPLQKENGEAEPSRKRKEKEKLNPEEKKKRRVEAETKWKGKEKVEADLKRKGKEKGEGEADAEDAGVIRHLYRPLGDCKTHHLDKVKEAFSALCRIVGNSDDEDVLTNVCSVLSCLTRYFHFENYNPVVIKRGTCQRLVDLLKKHSDGSCSFLAPALSIIANIAAHDDQSELLLELDIIPCLASLLEKRTEVLGVCRALANMSWGKGRQHQIAAIMRAELINPLLKLVDAPKMHRRDLRGIGREAAHVISSCITGCAADGIKDLRSMIGQEQVRRFHYCPP